MTESPISLQSLRESRGTHESAVGLPPSHIQTQISTSLNRVCVWLRMVVSAGKNRFNAGDYPRSRGKEH